MLLTGVEYVVKALVDLRVGEVGGEYGEDVAGVRDGVGDGFVGVASVPIARAESSQGRYGTVETVETNVASGGGVLVESGLIEVLVM